MIRRILVTLWALVFFSPAACNAYLMVSRPVVHVGNYGHDVPANWMCGRVMGGPYCVIASPRDRNIQTLTLFIFLIVGVPGLAYQALEAKQRRR